MTGRSTENPDLKGLVSFYRQNAERHGNDIGAVAWGSRQSQEKRFQILAEIADLNGRSVLDVGCGLGDFYGWLKQEQVNVRYSGIDITQSMIDLAQQSHPGEDFQVVNILDAAPSPTTYDYVFASGVFNRRVPGHQSFVNDSVVRMFDLCRYGMAFNILSIKADLKEPDEYHADPGEMLDFCLSLSRKATLRHDYMTHDFTVYVFKESL